MKKFLVFLLSLGYLEAKSITHGTSRMGIEGLDPDAKPASCNRPAQSNGLAVDTDGGDANGSGTHQNQQSYQHLWGGTIDPARVLGAVNIDRSNGLTGGDIICYKNEENGMSVCGVVFDNGYSENQTVGTNKYGNRKPEEATAPLHKAIGASNATGAGSDLSNTSISTQPIKLSGPDREMLNNELKLAKTTGNYERVNKLIQDIAQKTGCLSFPLNYDSNILTTQKLN